MTALSWCKTGPHMHTSSKCLHSVLHASPAILHVCFACTCCCDYASRTSDATNLHNLPRKADCVSTQGRASMKPDPSRELFCDTKHPESAQSVRHCWYTQSERCNVGLEPREQPSSTRAVHEVSCIVGPPCTSKYCPSAQIIGYVPCPFRSSHRLTVGMYSTHACADVNRLSRTHSSVSRFSCCE